ncbi:MAG: hypothetical protein KJP25_09210 [Gammaproteobacteria bacterium]|nr:hypothetical protein [Gammaproteobacteria bacterium]NND39211.1 hypothetical protein [Pseudomonadales bacterium]MBT8151767.1 hypothetical protein [Gammaproteobacteria bacterium]NNL10310.1 hypothetical protein [Pseudomonadales bacterium]NNM11683.1 hypothetical protein [Pseudomonadales bacterium]
MNAGPGAWGEQDYPKFLRTHIASSWSAVSLDALDPEICFRVDAALASCGCHAPTAELRQYMYCFASGADFDYEMVSALIEVFSGATAESRIADLLALDFERDCGLPREAYLQRLFAIASNSAGSENLVSQPWALEPEMALRA